MQNRLPAELENRLKQGILPGRGSQMKMAPRGRDMGAPGIEARHASVLLLLFSRDGDLRLLLTRRHDYGGPHSGQVSFPGGKADPLDTDQAATAMRETLEETGINPQSYTILGKLSELYIPVSKYLVHPYVAYAAHVPTCTPDPKEVRYIFDLSLVELLDDACRKSRLMRLEGIDYEIPYFALEGETIWGATAMILSEFIELVRSLSQARQG